MFGLLRRLVATGRRSRVETYGLTAEAFADRVARSSTAPDQAPNACCKVRGSLSVTTTDGERFVGRCLVCGANHRRAFPNLSKLLQAVP